MFGACGNEAKWFEPRRAAPVDPPPQMHFKSYQIDGRLLRTGAANFSASGLKRQDNELIVIESTEAAAVFKYNFEARFGRADTLFRATGQ